MGNKLSSDSPFQELTIYKLQHKTNVFSTQIRQKCHKHYLLQYIAIDSNHQHANMSLSRSSSCLGEDRMPGHVTVRRRRLANAENDKSLCRITYNVSSGTISLYSLTCTVQ